MKQLTVFLTVVVKSSKKVRPNASQECFFTATFRLGYKTLCERNIIHLMCIGFFCFLMHVSLLGTSCIFLDVNFPGTEMAGKGTTQFMNEKLAEETPMFSKVSTWALKTNLRCTVFVCMFFPFIHSWFLLLSQREYIPFVHFCSEAGDFFTGIST